MTTSEIDNASHVLHQLATQAFNLGMGLQNAAPPQSPPGSSVQYLKEISVHLENTARKIDELKG
jgi:hypothetical protein